MSTEVALDIGQVHRLSTDEYHRLIEAGGFDEDARVELIDGLLADMSPKTGEGDGYLEVAEVHAPGELIPVGLEIGATRIDALLRATAA